MPHTTSSWLPRALTGAVVPLALLAGCSTDSGGDASSPAPATTTAAAPTPSASATSGLTAADEAAIRQTFQKYQDVYRKAYTTGDTDPKVWSGLVNDELLSVDLAGVKNYVDQDITFSGHQVYGDVTITSTGEGAAVIHTCLDESDWLGTEDGTPLPPRPTDVYPINFAAIKVQDAWILGVGPKVPAGSTC